MKHYSYDFTAPDTAATVNPMVTIQEHPVDGPVSYMAINNIKNAQRDAEELLLMINMCDDLPQWADQALSEAADRLSKIKRYVYSRKSDGGPGCKVASYDY
jgi:hypothetical protein